jgi:hypothetical protein
MIRRARRADGKPLTSARPPELITAFESGRIVPQLADIPSGCLCTWIPGPGGWRRKFAWQGCPCRRIL